MQKLPVNQPISLPPSTPRDVLKTMIQGWIHQHLDGQQQLSPRDREQLEEDLCEEDQLDKTVEDLLEADKNSPDVPIQIGFGIGAPVPPVQN